MAQGGAIASAFSGRRTRDVTSDNPFVRISAGARLIIAAYFLFWRILPELAGSLHLGHYAADVVVVGLLVRVLTEALLLAPFMLDRFAGIRIGWLHPLTLPTLLTIAKDVVTNPLGLGAVATAWLSAPTFIEYSLMSGLPREAHLEVELRRDVFLLVAQLSYLTGFALLSSHARLRSTSLANVSAWRLLTLVGLSFGAFVLLVAKGDGLLAHFARLAYGRFTVLEEAGHLLVLINLMPFVLALWYAARPTIAGHPSFHMLFLAALVAQFITTGSRSSLIAPVVLMLGLWMMINRRAPASRIALLGVLITILLGTLGELRGSASRNAGVVDLSVLTRIEVLSGAQSTIEERIRRDEAAGVIAIMHAVPERVPHLYGTTYLSSLLFFVPRTIWPEKPRGPGAHVGAIIYGGEKTTSHYAGTGFPAGGIGEAYWNFGSVGVILIYSLFGLFHRFIAHKFATKPWDPFRRVLLLVSMIVLVDPSSDSIVRFLQVTVSLYISWMFVRRRPTQASAVPAP